MKHRARVIWSGEVGPVRAPVKAVENRRPSNDGSQGSEWLLATVDIGSARRLARLCQEHDAYRWMKRSQLSRVVHQGVDGLLTQIIGSLMAAGSGWSVWLKTGCEYGQRRRCMR